MTYIILTGIAGLSFTAGWLMKSISVANLISKAYSKGWNTGYGYRDSFER